MQAILGVLVARRTRMPGAQPRAALRTASIIVLQQPMVPRQLDGPAQGSTVTPQRTSACHGPHGSTRTARGHSPPSTQTCAGGHIQDVQASASRLVSGSRQQSAGHRRLLACGRSPLRLVLGTAITDGPSGPNFRASGRRRSAATAALRRRSAIPPTIRTGAWSLTGAGEPTRRVQSRSASPTRSTLRSRTRRRP